MWEGDTLEEKRSSACPSRERDERTCNLADRGALGDVLFGVIEPGSVLGSIMVAPEFVWELSLGIWLVVKGFDRSALASLSTNPDDGVLTGADQLAGVPSDGSVR